MNIVDRALVISVLIFIALLFSGCAGERGPQGEPGLQGPPGETIIEIIYPCEVEYNVTLKTKKKTVVEKVELNGTFCGMKVSE